MNKSDADAAWANLVSDVENSMPVIGVPDMGEGASALKPVREPRVRIRASPRRPRSNGSTKFCPGVLCKCMRQFKNCSVRNLGPECVFCGLSESDICEDTGVLTDRDKPADMDMIADFEKAVVYLRICEIQDSLAQKVATCASLIRKHGPSMGPIHPDVSLEDMKYASELLADSKEFWEQAITPAYWKGGGIL